MVSLCNRNQLRENNTLKDIVKDHEKCTENAETVEYQHKKEIMHLQVINSARLIEILIGFQFTTQLYKTLIISANFSFGVQRKKLFITKRLSSRKKSKKQHCKLPTTPTPFNNLCTQKV